MRTDRHADIYCIMFFTVFIIARKLHCIVGRLVLLFYVDTLVVSTFIYLSEFCISNEITLLF